MPAPLISPWTWTTGAAAPVVTGGTPHYRHRRSLGGGSKLVYIGMLGMFLISVVKVGN